MVGSENIYFVGEACADVQAVIAEVDNGRTLIWLAFIYSPYSKINIYCIEFSAQTKNC